MTAARYDTSPSLVRPFESRLVRQEWATQVVWRMADPVDVDRRPLRRSIAGAAYEQAPAALFVYRMRCGPDDHVGVVADVRLQAFVNGDIRGHESVDPERVDALVRHYAGAPRSELVALLHAPDPAAAGLVADACRGRPVLHFRGPDDVEHTVWRVEGDLESTELAAALGRGVLYIADGHHRVAATIRAWELAGKPDGAGLPCVLFPMADLRLLAFHRRIRGPVDAALLLDAATTDFVVREVSSAEHSTGIGLYVAGRWHDLALSEPRPEGSAGLDAAVLQDRVLGPVLGVTGPGHPDLEVVPAHVPLENVTAHCDADGGALFVLRPPSLPRLTETADRGEVMPPKTTYFAPKPCAGIFLT